MENMAYSKESKIPKLQFEGTDDKCYQPQLKKGRKMKKTDKILEVERELLPKICEYQTNVADNNGNGQEELEEVAEEGNMLKDDKEFYKIQSEKLNAVHHETVIMQNSLTKLGFEGASAIRDIKLEIRKNHLYNSLLLEDSDELVDLPCFAKEPDNPMIDIDNILKN